MDGWSARRRLVLVALGVAAIALGVAILLDARLPAPRPPTAHPTAHPMEHGGAAPAPDLSSIEQMFYKTAARFAQARGRPPLVAG
jgi:hypothetical protein